jgi:hypothetical protein
MGHEIESRCGWCMCGGSQQKCILLFKNQFCIAESSKQETFAQILHHFLLALMKKRVHLFEEEKNCAEQITPNG